MSTKKVTRPKWHHHHLVARVRYALYGPGYSTSDAYWATVIKVSPDLRQPQSGLLSLPAELRNKIFELLNEGAVISTDLKCVSYDQAPLRSLLMTCRQMVLDLEHYPLNIGYLMEHLNNLIRPIIRFTGLTTVRWIVPSTLGYMVDENDKIIAWTWWMRQNFKESLCPDLRRLHLKLIIEKPEIDFFVTKGWVQVDGTSGTEILKKMWELEVVKAIKRTNRNVEVIFEYEMIETLWNDRVWFAWVQNLHSLEDIIQ